MLLKEVIFPFHGLERDMPIRVNGKVRNENDSEHSWSLALFTLVLAPKVDAKLDVGRAVQLAIVHDIVEIYAGDTSFWAPEEYRNTKNQREEEALNILEEKFGSIFPNLIELIEEYEAKETPEALFVSSLDKLNNNLVIEQEAEHYFKNNGITHKQYEKAAPRHAKKGRAYKPLRALYDEQLQKFLDNKNWYAK